MALDPPSLGTTDVESLRVYTAPSTATILAVPGQFTVPLPPLLLTLAVPGQFTVTLPPLLLWLFLVSLQ